MDWEFCRKINCIDRASVPRLRDEFWAREWLRHAMGDPSKMSAIRTFLAAEIGSKNLYNEPDEAIVGQMARLLNSGSVHIHELPQKGPYSEEDRPWGVPTIGSAKPGPFPVSESRRRAPVRSYREPPIESPTFSNINVAAQAAVLTAAAADGRPFCPE